MLLSYSITVLQKNKKKHKELSYATYVQLLQNDYSQRFQVSRFNFLPEYRTRPNVTKPHPWIDPIHVHC